MSTIDSKTKAQLRRSLSYERARAFDMRRDFDVQSQTLIAEVERLRAVLAEIARPKRGGIEASDSDEDWIEYLRGALDRERQTARNALKEET